MTSSTTAAAGPTAAPEHEVGGQGLALAVIASWMLLVGIDATIMNVALPDMQAPLHFKTADLAWVLNGYTLAFGGLLLLGGRLGDIMGRRNAFVAGVVIFTVASAVGGAATTGWMLIAARIVQGAGAALAGPSTMALLMTTFPGASRARALAVYSAVGGAGASVGLIAGGVLTDFASWRWVLFANVPIGLVMAILTPRLVKTPPRNPAVRLDIVGAVLGTLGVGGLTYAFIRAASAGWGERWVVASFVATGVLLVLFLIVELRVKDPVTPIHLFGDRRRNGAFLATLFLTAAMFSPFFLLTQFQEGVFGFSPLRLGLAFLPMTAGQFGAIRLVPKLLPKYGPLPLLGGGITLIVIGMAWLTQLSVDSGYWSGVFAPLLLIGIGGGICFPTLNMSILQKVEMKDSAAASGLLQTLQWVGGTIGLAVFVTIFGNALRADSTGNATHALAHGVATAFLAAAVCAAGALVAALISFRGRRATA
ncbi:MFS transporter [Actinoplanes sp. N902-109]|uniref:MFS transporter n=1 Tax=Actinoplanes sp. (strain N902-109) TaxID=649831 RepID=UPI0003295B46|nr:MFS transporter [Actinoplanes sp. N902-109]AGL15947.1 MFS family multidrug efflux protein [Actinoplanes sp. N902-109]